jgi:hypothetical protein
MCEPLQTALLVRGFMGCLSVWKRFKVRKEVVRLAITEEASQV